MRSTALERWCQRPQAAAVLTCVTGCFKDHFTQKLLMPCVDAQTGRSIYLSALRAISTLILICGCQSTPSETTLSSTHAPLFGDSVSATEHSNEDLHTAWNEWGVQNLQDGDLIFILGTSRLFMGLFDFAKFSTEIADSPFSHIGIVAIEDGRPWVYDTVSSGPRRKELGWYLSRKSIQRVAFRRPRKRHHAAIPGVIAFCRQVYTDQIPYDEGLVHGNDKYYCSELIDEAFRRQGIVLATSTPITELPNFASFPRAVAAMAEAATPISRHQSVLFPGNESYGMWSSTELELVLSPQSPQQIPQNFAARDSETAKRL